jgi:hypothetical protein
MSDPLQLYSIHESGAIGSWEWTVQLFQNADGSCRAVLEQMLWEDAGDAEAGFYELEKFSHGAELVEFLQDAWSNDHEEALDDVAWQEMVNALGAKHGPLASQVSRAVQVMTAKADSVRKSELTLVDRCIQAAVWERDRYSGGGAMWAAIGEGRRMHDAISAYVRKYHGQHGVVPEGRHEILGKAVTFPRSK